MMRSMFSGVSSLRVHQTRMDVIANNIANVNTDGFKSQRATFNDSFYQNLQGASGPTLDPMRAGRNPQQVGLGVGLASIDNMMHQGVARRTDNALDVTIEGRGFFIVRDQGGANFFTRAGRIEADSHWNLHIGGMQLMGWSTVPCRETAGGHRVARGVLQPLNLSGEKQIMPSEPTTLVRFSGNLNVTSLQGMDDDDSLGDGYAIRTKTIYDSLGNSYSFDVRMRYFRGFSTAADRPHGYWTMELPEYFFQVDADGQVIEESIRPARNPDGTLRTPAADEQRGVRAFLENDRRPGAPITMIGVCLIGGAAVAPGSSAADFGNDAVTTVTVAFDSNGNFIGMGRATADGLPIQFLNVNQEDEWTDDDEQWVRGSRFDISIVPIAGVAPSATFGDVNRAASNYHAGATPPAEDSTVIRVGTINLDFRELGQRGGSYQTTLQILRMDGGGPGTLRDISVGGDGVIMGHFSNGRDRVLGQIPVAEFINPAGLQRVGNSLWRATANSGPFDGVGQDGSMIGGSLEMSNVDLANEFTEMITTQRGFQAASRTITVSDEMLQELVNLRR
ncbi:MAG: flagellar hook protein FlgE [Defluviitaleaceae bacterium]|nr:flagellar hook protein FlgE [Defluviitaleaceae bacterium]